MDSLYLPARRALIDLCQRWQIMERAVFGSLDLRAEFADFSGRTVDLVEEKAIRNPCRRASIFRDKSVLYVA
jgi:uncharacterized protein